METISIRCVVGDIASPTTSEWPRVRILIFSENFTSNLSSPFSIPNCLSLPLESMMSLSMPRPASDEEIVILRQDELRLQPSHIFFVSRFWERRNTSIDHQYSPNYFLLEKGYRLKFILQMLFSANYRRELRMNLILAMPRTPDWLNVFIDDYKYNPSSDSSLRGFIYPCSLRGFFGVLCLDLLIHHLIIKSILEKSIKNPSAAISIFSMEIIAVSIRYPLVLR